MLFRSPQDMRWKEFYIHIANLDYYRRNNILPKLDITGIDEKEVRDTYVNQYPELFRELINIYAFNGDVFKVNILHQITGELPDFIMLLGSAQKGNLEMVQWFTEHNIKHPDAFAHAAQDGRITVMDYLSELNQNQDYELAAEYASQRENLPALLWLEKRNIYPLPQDYDNAIGSLNYDIINFGLRTQTLTQIRRDTLDSILQFKTLEEINKLFKLLFSHGVEIVE